MILILSTPRDSDTQIVVENLQHSNAAFFRLNDEDIMSGLVTLNLVPNDLNNSYLIKEDKKIYFSDVKVVWMRKFGFFKTYEDFFGKKADLTRYIYSEFSVIRNLIFKLLEGKKWLFKRSNMLTKIETLNLANEVGLKTPNSLITSSIKQLEVFFEENNNLIISKSIGEGKHIELNNKNYPFFTQIINSLDGLPDTFSPSMFQEYINKKYELRAFFLDNKIYTMVIFSQNNEKTKIDFRNYDIDKPNRVGRYQLPQLIEEKVINLMNKIGLNTGSIDIIKSVNNDYYFLEVNPSGQFGMTSIPCNYNLHKKISNYLIENNE
ncbi:grasp-with-spasm system ATP-grasp peptide maturase [Flavobacterium sp. 316]|uniref:grasp-with-spasm system ATP-grasp peptide maturase n=1 Tax=Flavobacterium sp. 316 TaxID=1603293 RepID=UPI000697B506|nr:grasp-with-spasm system ATP-grasp peptide maturase [Flavobacterium sp. 316]